MKMTTEQFLSHLGIEVGKEFGIDTIYHWKNSFFKIEKIGDDFKLCERSEHSNWNIVSNPIGWLIDQEITPLPKYTLTEAERVIVDIEFSFEDLYIQRKSEGLLSIRNKDLYIAYLDDDLFKFIKPNSTVSLDELRKCL